MATPVVVSEVSKSFTMHLRDGIRLPVVEGVSFAIKSGECAVLGGPSGAGKSSILKMLYGNYAVDAGQIIVDASRPARRSRDRQPAPRAFGPARHDRLCQPVPAHGAARLCARCRRRTAGVARRGQGSGAQPGARAARPPQPARKTLEPAARDLFRRRAAARQHRARLHHAASGVAARRADGIARRQEPRGRRRA